MSRMKKWPFLWQLVESGHFLTIEYAFAENGATEEEATLLAAVFAFYRLGHICLHIERQEIRPSLALLSPHPDELEKRIRLVKKSSFVIQEENRFYLPKLWRCEEEFIKETVRLVNGSNHFTNEQRSLSQQITQEQERAIRNAWKYPLSLIAGGPGTGKSFTAVEIAKTFLELGKTAIFFTAPTGKAVANLEKRCSFAHCCTLHALLEMQLERKSSKDPPWIHIDLLLVDESSMIHAALFARLMKAVRGNTHLVLMGDPHQLSAIEGGSFFSDLLSSESIPSTHLSRPFRFGKEDVFALSQAVLQADLLNIPLTPFPLNREKWIFDRVCSYFPKPQSSPPEKVEGFNRFRILTAFRKGPYGTDALNELLVWHFRALGQSGEYFIAPILIGRDVRRTGLCNGESGLLVQQIGVPKEDYALFEGEKRFSREQLPSFEYAYAISIHKSQGSEYEEVLVILPEGAEIFGRELIYTGVTRAKNRVEIIADPICITR